MTHLFIIMMIMVWVAPQQHLLQRSSRIYDDSVEDNPENKNMRIMLKTNLLQEVTPLFIIMVWDRAGRMARRVWVAREDGQCVGLLVLCSRFSVHSFVSLCCFFRSLDLCPLVPTTYWAFSFKLNGKTYLFTHSRIYVQDLVYKYAFDGGVHIILGISIFLYFF